MFGVWPIVRDLTNQGIQGQGLLTCDWISSPWLEGQNWIWADRYRPDEEDLEVESQKNVFLLVVCSVRALMMPSLSHDLFQDPALPLWDLTFNEIWQTCFCPFEWGPNCSAVFELELGFRQRSLKGPSSKLVFSYLFAIFMRWDHVT